MELLDYRELVRRRPGMYIGGTGPGGRMHLVLELVGNAVDLVLLEQARTIDVSLHGDGSVEVSDDGPGVDIFDPVVHGWFADGHERPTADGHHPHVHLYSSGVGAAVVNFLSTRFRIVTSFKGVTATCEWSEGGSRFSGVSVTAHQGPGTAVRFWPDQTIFDGVDIASDRLRSRLRELACLIPGCRISLDGEPWSFEQWDIGLAALGGASSAHACAQSTIAVDGLDISLKMALIDQDEALGADFLVYANYQRMGDEGPFTRALRQALTEINEPRSVLPNRVAVVSLTMLEPSIGGPSKARLDDLRAIRALEAFFRNHLADLRGES